MFFAYHPCCRGKSKGALWATTRNSSAGAAPGTSAFAPPPPLVRQIYKKGYMVPTVLTTCCGFACGFACLIAPLSHIATHTYYG